MFVYALAKGVRRGFLPGESLEVARRGHAGLLDRYVSVDEQGLVSLGGVCSVAGLGGNPYRDGSYEYYVRENVAVNDFKGVGAFILASVEIKRAKQSSS